MTVIVYAVRDGRWSDPATWNTGELPRRGWIVVANGHTVTIDVNVSLGRGRLSTREHPPGRPGGRFVILPGVRVRCSAIEWDERAEPIVSAWRRDSDGGGVCGQKRQLV